MEASIWLRAVMLVLCGSSLWVSSPEAVQEHVKPMINDPCISYRFVLLINICVNFVTNIGMIKSVCYALIKIYQAFCFADTFTYGAEPG